MSDFIKQKKFDNSGIYSSCSAVMFNREHVCTKHTDKKALSYFFSNETPPDLFGNAKRIFESLQQRVSRLLIFFATRGRSNYVDHFNQ